MYPTVTAEYSLSSEAILGERTCKPITGALEQTKEMLSGKVIFRFLRENICGSFSMLFGWGRRRNRLKR